MIPLGGQADRNSAIVRAMSVERRSVAAGSGKCRIPAYPIGVWAMLPDRFAGGANYRLDVRRRGAGLTLIWKSRFRSAHA